MLGVQNYVDKACAPVTRRGRKYLMASAAVTLIVLNGISSAGANEWTGIVNNDFFNPLNWDDEQGPKGTGSSVNDGNAHGLIDLSQSNYSGGLAEKIGTQSGKKAVVTIDIKPDPSYSFNDVGLDFGADQAIGTGGGKGILNINMLDPVITHGSSGVLTIGSGQGSEGEFNIIGTGKDAGQVPPEGPVIVDHECYDCETAYLMSAKNIIIGEKGGKGKLTVDGSILGVLDYDSLTIGDGGGSYGELNVLAGGKFNDAAFSQTNTTQSRVLVGVNGGVGVINAIGSGSADRGDAPMLLLGNGLALGDGAGSHGSLNVLAGGKAHSYLVQDYDSATPPQKITSVGLNSGVGEINASGKGSVFYQSGMLDGMLSRYKLFPGGRGGPLEDRVVLERGLDEVSSSVGDLHVGESGTGSLNIADNGVVRIGAAKFAVGYYSDAGTYGYALVDHKAEGSLFLADKAGSAGTLNIGGKQGAAATSAGRLMAKDIVFGEGSGLVRFNHTETDYVFDKFDAKFMDGPSRAQTLQLKGKGTIETVSGRTIFEEDQLDFTGNINIKNVGILQVNKDISGADVNLTGGVLEGVGTVGNVENKGILAPGKALGNSENSIGTLTVKGDYHGNGGGVLIDTVLGDDNSVSDKLVITGKTSGKSTVEVRNIGGKGADTIEGIEIITVGEQSDGEFKLIGDYIRRSVDVVVAGAHTYKLHQGSVSNSTNGNWYLRSETEDEGYQAGIPVYEAYPQFLLGLNNLPTMQQRVGNRYWNNAGNMMITQGTDAVEVYAPAQEVGSVTQANGVWGRIEGAHTKMEPNTSITDANYDFNAYKMQAGLDGMVYENEQGRLIAGGTVHYTHGLASIWSPYDADLGRGRIKTDGYGLGANLSWFGDDGFYVDNQAQLTWYRSELSYEGDESELKDGKNNGFGYALSSEIGKRFALNQYWSLTPQAHLQYSNVDFSDFKDVFGAHISRQKGESLHVRLGMSVDYQNSWQNAQGMTNRSSIYGITNLFNEFLSGTKVRVSTEDFINKNERVWGGIGFGGSYAWDNDKYALYGEGSVNTSLQHFGDSYTYKGSMGVRVRW